MVKILGKKILGLIFGKILGQMLGLFLGNARSIAWSIIAFSRSWNEFTFILVSCVIAALR